MTFGDYIIDLKAFFVYHGMQYRHIYRDSPASHILRYNMPGCNDGIVAGVSHEGIVWMNQRDSEPVACDSDIDRIALVRKRIIQHVVYYLHGYQTMPHDPLSIDQEAVRNHADACAAWRWYPPNRESQYERHMDSQPRRHRVDQSRVATRSP